MRANSRCSPPPATRSSPLAEAAVSAPILILAPTGRDAKSIGHVLEDSGLPWQESRTMEELCAALSLDTPMLVLTEEGLAGHSDHLTACLDGQPAWSDLPLLLLSAGGVRRGGEARWRLFERLGNVTILDRPLHIGSLQGAVRSALRARTRQYLARTYLEELEASRADLERRVGERTAQLEKEMAERRSVEAALARAQRLEAIGQLTGGVAHDFNNLLQIVIGSLSMLERHAGNPDRRATALEAIRQASERGARLTQQLLAFARRQPLAPEAIDVAARIEEMQDLLRGSLPADLPLHLRLAPDLWPVKTDVTQLEVAVLNLVVNARDATRGGGHVTVSAHNVVLTPQTSVDDLQGEFVRITVADTGCGMDEETLHRAVEPFYTTKPLGKGTGLGLSQVYGFARQCGGTVHMESTLGVGSAVCIFLPRSFETPAAALPEPDDEPDSHGGGRILIAEDEEAVAKLACEMVQDLGYECTRVPNADEALALDLERFDAVFSDVVMPGKIDGIALAHEVKRRRPAMPVLLATGYSGKPGRLAEAGFPVLRKPYTLDELRSALRALLTSG